MNQPRASILRRGGSNSAANSNLHTRTKSPSNGNGTPNKPPNSNLPPELLVQVPTPNNGEPRLLPIWVPLSIMASSAAKKAGGNEVLSKAAADAVLSHGTDEGRSVSKDCGAEVALRCVHSVASRTYETLEKAEKKSGGSGMIVVAVRDAVKGGGELLVKQNQDKRGTPPRQSHAANTAAIISESRVDSHVSIGSRRQSGPSKRDSPPNVLLDRNSASNSHQPHSNLSSSSPNSLPTTQTSPTSPTSASPTSPNSSASPGTGNDSSNRIQKLEDRMYTALVTLNRALEAERRHNHEAEQQRNTEKSQSSQLKSALNASSKSSKKKWYQGVTSVGSNLSKQSRASFNSRQSFESKKVTWRDDDPSLALTIDDDDGDNSRDYSHALSAIDEHSHERSIENDEQPRTGNGGHLNVNGNEVEIVPNSLFSWNAILPAWDDRNGRGDSATAASSRQSSKAELWNALHALPPDVVEKNDVDATNVGRKKGGNNDPSSASVSSSASSNGTFRSNNLSLNNDGAEGKIIRIPTKSSSHSEGGGKDVPNSTGNGGVVSTSFDAAKSSDVEAIPTSIFAWNALLPAWSEAKSNHGRTKNIGGSISSGGSSRRGHTHSPASRDINLASPSATSGMSSNIGSMQSSKAPLFNILSPIPPELVDDATLGTKGTQASTSTRGTDASKSSKDSHGSNASKVTKQFSNSNGSNSSRNTHFSKRSQISKGSPIKNHSSSNFPIIHQISHESSTSTATGSTHTSNTHDEEQNKRDNQLLDDAESLHLLPNWDDASKTTKSSGSEATERNIGESAVPLTNYRLMDLVNGIGIGAGYDAEIEASKSVHSHYTQGTIGNASQGSRPLSQLPGLGSKMSGLTMNTKPLISTSQSGVNGVSIHDILEGVEIGELLEAADNYEEENDMALLEGDIRDLENVDAYSTNRSITTRSILSQHNKNNKGSCFQCANWPCIGVEDVCPSVESTEDSNGSGRSEEVDDDMENTVFGDQTFVEPGLEVDDITVLNSKRSVGKKKRSFGRRIKDTFGKMSCCKNAGGDGDVVHTSSEGRKKTTDKNGDLEMKITMKSKGRSGKMKHEKVIDSGVFIDDFNADRQKYDARRSEGMRASEKRKFKGQTSR